MNIPSLIQMIEIVRTEYELEQYAQSELDELNSYLQKAKNELFREIRIKAGNLTEFREDRIVELLIEFDRMTIGIQNEITNNISDIAAGAEAQALSATGEILSFGGRVAGFNFVSLSAKQLMSYIRNTPVGGSMLEDWVRRTFSDELIGRIKEEVTTGALKGESYRKIFNRLSGRFDNVTSRQIETLMKTYIQEANNKARELVYKANSDIIKQVQWSSVLEPGSKKTGRGVCLRCASLDGNKYDQNSPKPSCPLHPNCRCMYLPVTVSWKELGINKEEIADVERPYAIRGKITRESAEEYIDRIGMGGRYKRKIIETGFIQGEYKDFYESRPDSFKTELVGPRRKELIESGQIDFKDLVNRQTGELILIRNLIQTN